jgi:hypothetical protein
MEFNISSTALLTGMHSQQAALLLYQLHIGLDAAAIIARPATIPFDFDFSIDSTIVPSSSESFRETRCPTLAAGGLLTWAPMQLGHGRIAIVL